MPHVPKHSCGRERLPEPGVCALKANLSWQDQFQPRHLRKVSVIESRDYTRALQCSRRQNQVVRTDHVAGRFQASPNPGMYQSCRLRVGNLLEFLNNGAQITFPFWSMRGGGPFDSMPKFGDSDRRNLEFLAGLSGEPSEEIETAPLSSDDHISIENYRHRSLGGFSILRAVTRSRCHALASSSERSTLRSASANSGPVHPLFSSGTS